MVKSILNIEKKKNELITKSVNRVTDFLKNKIKEQFVVETHFTVYDKDSYVYMFLNSRIKNFENYVYNVNNKSRIKFKNMSIPVKFDKNTFFLVIGGRKNLSMNTNEKELKLIDKTSFESENTLIIIFFGKNSYALSEALKKKELDYLFSDELFQFDVTFTKDERGTQRTDIKRNILRNRELNSLFYENGVVRNIKNHLDSFISNKNIYESKNIIHKTGMLFYGSPGTGKTSLALAIANYLNCSMIVFDMSTFKDMNISDMTSMLNADDKMYVILLEDFDAIVKTRESEETQETEKIKQEQQLVINKMLQFLDSNSSPSNVVFIATTNYIDKIDPAISRGGRFDYIAEIEGISYDIAVSMCKSFELNQQQISEVLGNDKNKKFNQSKLQTDILEQIKKELRKSYVE